MFYPQTTGVIRHELERAFSKVEGVEGIERSLRDHILWMVEFIEGLDPSSWENAVKAASWLGYILAICEHEFGFWGNDRSRELVRIDKEGGYHAPH